MYEEYFGLTGRPFQLSPDPAYFYGSRGHSRALSYLKFGVFQAEGFIVVTGSIGAGKTTLLRALIDGLDASKIVAVQLVSTQLDANDLLRAVAVAFGLPVKDQSKAETLASVEAYLTSLLVQGKRALLVVDEAQNLEPRSIEELRMLSNFQIRDRGLIQSVLVGQPELRQMIRSQPMEQLRQRIIASYHLEAMNAADSKAYILHRLNKAGWKRDPVFTEDAFDQIFKAAQGLPRKINLLCNRLLLAAFLAGEHELTAQTVSNVSGEIDEEIGVDSADSENFPLPAMKSAAQSQFAAQPVPALAQTPRDAALSRVTVAAVESAAVVADNGAGSASICVFATGGDLIKAAPLIKALGMRLRLGAAKLVRIDYPDAGQLESLPEWPFVPKPDHIVISKPGSKPMQIAQLMAEINPILEQTRASCVVLFDASDASLACALVATKRGISIAHVGELPDTASQSGQDDVNARLIKEMSQVRYVAEPAMVPEAADARINPEIKRVGSLTADYVRDVLPNAVPVADTMQRSNQSVKFFDQRKGYGLIALNEGFNLNTPERLTSIVGVLATVSKAVPLVWPVTASLRAQLAKASLSRVLADTRIAFVDQRDFLQELGLLDKAAFVLTDSDLMQEWSAALGRPCLVLPNSKDGTRRPILANCSLVKADKKDVLRHVSEILDSESKPDDINEFWDGRAAARIAADLSDRMR
jgi:general secretion pathway protein A